jgi:glycosyltransferase involved in cell wall biosynthesis
METPLVSCVMPTTAARKNWIPRAIRYWQRQTYEMRELVIVSDGAERIDRLIPKDDPRIRYKHLATDQTLGTKRNLANALTRGPLICHWDDDDWYHPARISLQVKAMQRSSAPLCGIRNLYWIEIGNGTVWKYRWGSSNNPRQAAFWKYAVNGNTMMYRRSFWEHSMFPDIQRGSDMNWLIHRDFTSCQPDDQTLVVGAIHDDNVSGKDRLPPYWSMANLQPSSLLGLDADEFVEVDAA